MKTVKLIIATVAAVVALGWAGKSDYEDAVLCEMKNNGAYWELSEQHPQASDGELIEMYEAANRDR